MNDDRDIIRGCSKDRRMYRDNNISDKTKLNQTSEYYQSNQNRPEILSLFTLTNKGFNEREKRIGRSVTNDTLHFNTINYSKQFSPSASFVSNLTSDNKEPMFPKLTPRSTATMKQFPTLTPRTRSNSSNVADNSPILTKRTSLKPLSPSLQTQIPIVSIERKKKVQLSRRE